MAGFYSARSETIPPLPWPNFAPPFPAQIGTLETLGETLATLQTDQDAAFTALEDSVLAALQSSTETDDTDSGTATALDSQMLRSLSDTVQQNHEDTRDAVTQGLSDLQLALSRMLADRPVAAAAPAPQAAPKPVTAAKSRPTPRPAAKAKPAPNPYSYP